MASEDEIRRVKERHEFRLLEIPGVQGVGIGDDGRRTAIKVYVDDVTPEVRQGVPGELDGVPVVIERSGTFEAL